MKMIHMQTGLALFAALLLLPATAGAQERTLTRIQSLIAVDGAGNASPGCGGNGNALTTALNNALGTPGFDDEGVGVANRRVAYRICDSLTGTGAQGWTGDAAGIPQPQYDELSIALAPEELFTEMDNARSAFDVQTANVARRLSLVRLARRDARRREAVLAQRPIARPGFDEGRGLARLTQEDQAEQVLLALRDGLNAGDGDSGSGLGLFLNGRINVIEGDDNASERSSRGFGGGFTLGADMPIDDQMFAGVALGYTHIDTRYDGTGSKSELDAVTVTGYYGFYPTDALYFDGSGTISWLGIKNRNEILVPDAGPPPGALEGEANGVNFGLDAGVGYALDIAELTGNENVRGLTFEPSFRVNYLLTYIEEYDQDGLDGSLDLEIGEQETNSLTLNLGFRTDYPISTKHGVVTPYVRAAYVFEALNENDDIKVGLAAVGSAGTLKLKAEATDSHYGNFGAGLAATLGQGLSQYVDYDVVAGHDNVTIHQVTAGLRLEY